MTDAQQQVSDELFATAELEGSTDVASTTESVATDLDEESAESLDLQTEESAPAEEKGESSKAKERRDQIDSWATGIMVNKKKLEDIPFGWLKQEVQKRIGELTPPPQVDETAINAIVERKLKMEMETRAFNDLKAQVEAMGLSRDEKLELAAEWKDNKSDGLGDYKALTKAMRVVGIDPARKQTENLRRSMTIPRMGSYGKTSEGTDPMKLPENKRIEFYEKQRKSTMAL